MRRTPGKITGFFLAILLSSLACRPVITIGWWELALIGGVILLMAAPLLIRLVRFFARMEASQDSGQEDAPE